MEIIKKVVIIGCLIAYFSSNAQPCLDSWCQLDKRKYRFWTGKKYPIIVDTSKVKVNGIYVNEFQWKEPNQDSSKYYNFFRFFEDGRVFISCEYCSLPDSTEMRDISRGKFRYYTIENGKVKLEVHNHKAGYYYSYFEIDRNKIEDVFTSNRTRWFKPIIHRSYKPRSWIFYSFEWLGKDGSG